MSTLFCPPCPACHENIFSTYARISSRDVTFFAPFMIIFCSSSGRWLKRINISACCASSMVKPMGSSLFFNCYHLCDRMRNAKRNYTMNTIGTIIVSKGRLQIQNAILTFIWYASNLKRKNTRHCLTWIPHILHGPAHNFAGQHKILIMVLFLFCCNKQNCHNRRHQLCRHHR